MKPYIPFVLSAAIGSLACAAPAYALSMDLPPTTYSQSYLTYWETENLGNGKAWYNFVVANTGDAVYSTTSNVISNGPPQVIEYHTHNEIPVITTYTIPILSSAAWSTVDQSSIYQPNGWNWRLVDATAQNWQNTTGNASFDHPYKVLEWYVADTTAPGNWHYVSFEHGLAPAFTTYDVQSWQADGPDNDPVNFWHSQDYDDNTGQMVWQTSASIWHEATAPAFGFLAHSGKTLSPDQTSWGLVIQDYTNTVTVLPSRPGDPDDPLKSSGIGGLAVPSAQVAAVPEPETYAMFLAGLGLLGLIGRRRRG